MSIGGEDVEPGGREQSINVIFTPLMLRTPSTPSSELGHVEILSDGDLHRTLEIIIHRDKVDEVMRIFCDELRAEPSPVGALLRRLEELLREAAEGRPH